MTPPAVSRPRESGVTSRSSSSDSFSDLSAPTRMAAWTVAPKATASSGLMDLQGSLPLKNSESMLWTLGMRVDPPTSTTSSTCLLRILAVAQDLLDGVHALLEVVHAQVLETGAGDGGVEVDAVEQGVDLDVRLGGRRERALGALAGRAEAAQGALVLAHVLAVLRLKSWRK